MEPEISRRCRRCGATVRARAQFCAQCGLPMTSQTHVAPPTANELRSDDSGGDGSAHSSQTDGAAGTNMPPRPMAADTPRANPVLPSPNRSSSLPSNAALPPPSVSPNSNAVNRARVVGRESDTARDRRMNPAQRAGRNVERDARPRAERLRDASIEVLDEAADDPGLRFVLVSLLLFVVFVVLLLASTFVFWSKVSKLHSKTSTPRAE